MLVATQVCTPQQREPRRAESKRAADMCSPLLHLPSSPSHPSCSSAAAIATSPSAAAPASLPGCACCSSAPSRQMGSSSVPAPCIPPPAAAATPPAAAAAPVAWRRRCARGLAAAGWARAGPPGRAPGCCCGGCANPKSAAAGPGAACMDGLDCASRLCLHVRKRQLGTTVGATSVTWITAAQMKQTGQQTSRAGLTLHRHCGHAVELLALLQHRRPPLCR